MGNYFEGYKDDSLAFILFLILILLVIGFMNGYF
jgi:hypothetical protein